MRERTPQMVGEFFSFRGVLILSIFLRVPSRRDGSASSSVGSRFVMDEPNFLAQRPPLTSVPGLSHLIFFSFFSFPQLFCVYARTFNRREILGGGSSVCVDRFDLTVFFFRSALQSLCNYAREGGQLFS